MLLCLGIQKLWATKFTNHQLLRFFAVTSHNSWWEQKADAHSVDTEKPLVLGASTEFGKEGKQKHYSK